MKIDISKGRYWDEGITLIDGCTLCSPGCDHCWALAMQKRFSGENKTIGKGIWLHPERLKRFRTRKPKVFSIWNDLFHEAVPWEFQYKSYESMWMYHWNHYLVLTKRPAKMLSATKEISFHLERNRMSMPKNTWHGLTVCNQQEADEKIPIFLQVPGKKFLSIEPALSNISLWEQHCNIRLVEYFDLIIWGAETGAGARHPDPEWARTIRDECDVTGVPFFLKQLDKKHNRILDGKYYNSLPWRNNNDEK